jgi:hypothetical protein
LVWGLRKETASNSWNAPLPVRFDSEEPARNKEGKALTEQLPIYINPQSANLNIFLSKTAAHACESMQNTWPSDQQADSGLACEIAISTGSIATSLFVSKSDEANAQVDCFFGDVDDRNAHKPEDDADAEITQCLGNDVSTRS